MNDLCFGFLGFGGVGLYETEIEEEEEVLSLRGSLKKEKCLVLRDLV